MGNGGIYIERQGLLSALLTSKAPCPSIGIHASLKIKANMIDGVSKFTDTSRGNKKTSALVFGCCNVGGSREGTFNFLLLLEFNAC